MKKTASTIIALAALLPINNALAQEITSENWISSPGIIGTIILITLVLVLAVVIVLARLSNYLRRVQKKDDDSSKLAFKKELLEMEGTEIDDLLSKRKAALEYKLKGSELGGNQSASDNQGLIKRAENEPDNPLFDEKKRPI